MKESESDIITTEKNQDKDKIKEINKLMNEIINTTKQYKNSNLDDLKEAVIKQIKDSKIKPENLKNQEKETLAHLAIRLDKFERVQIIIEAYKILLENSETLCDWILSENKEKETALDLVVQFGNKQIINYIYDIISKTTESKLRITEHRKGLFHYAAMYDQSYPIIFFHEKLQKHFKKDTIIDISSEYGITPLHCACIKGSNHAVDLLLDLGANINAKDNEGNNCVHYAVISNNPNLVKKLIIRGADKTVVNQKNETPLDLALKNNFRDIIDILSAKNSIISNPCSSKREIVGLRSSHNNITLFVIILFMGLGKWIYLSRMNYVYEGNIKLDVVPFIYEIETIKEICYYGNNKIFTNCTINDTLLMNYALQRKSARGFLNNIKQLFDEDTFGYSVLEGIYYTGWGISMFEAVILLFILKFMCFSGLMFVKKNKLDEKNPLITLFENHKNICVKCRTVKKEKTVHCIVCNGCVENFDHHCSWLNICINKNNLPWFRAFLYIFLAYILFNILFFAYSK